MNQDEFIDLCIMCGCDYTANIPGIGPIKAFKYIQECKSIEGVIKRIDKENTNPQKKTRYQVPENFNYEQSRELFKNPDVETDKAKLQEMIKWNNPDEEGLKQFLVEQKGFTEIKVDNGIKKLKSCKGKTNQARLDCFFKAKPAVASSIPATKAKQIITAKGPQAKKSMPVVKK